MRRMGADTTKRPTKTTSNVPDREIRKKPMKKVSRVFDVQKTTR